MDFFEKNGLPTVRLEVLCGKGTYIRSLAHDLGEDLGIGGFLSSLIRTKVGDFHVDDSMRITEFEEKLKA